MLRTARTINASLNSPNYYSPLLLVLLFVSAAFVRFLPSGCLVYDDSSIFLYVGQRLLAGDQLYTEVWDHKPPLIFWINKAGLFVALRENLNGLPFHAAF